MFRYGYKYDDPNNSKRGRNIRNSNRDHYNCAGYALDCFSWYCPFDDLETDLEKNVQKILKDFPNTRVISSEKDLLPNEHMIAFRLSSEDFHFMKRARNGVWYQKIGRCNPIFTVPKDVVYGKIWNPHRLDGGYRGEIVFFAVGER